MVMALWKALCYCFVCAIMLNNYVLDLYNSSAQSGEGHERGSRKMEHDSVRRTTLCHFARFTGEKLVCISHCKKRDVMERLSINRVQFFFGLQLVVHVLGVDVKIEYCNNGDPASRMWNAHMNS